MPEPHLRAGDTDRAAVATVLGRHMADGRLTVAEYDERVARAYAARTYGDLDELTADLPATATTAGRSPDPVRREHPVSAHACGSMAGRRRDAGSAWGAWRRTAIIVLCIWAISSIAATQFIYFWPIWVVGPWGAVLLAQSVGGDRRPRSRQHT